MIPGGVMCDPTKLDLIMMENYLQTAISFFEKTMTGIDLENYLEEIERLHTIYIEQTSKDLKQNSELILTIYQKIQNLNIIERYIFISRIKSVKKQKTKEKELKIAIKYYFKEFLSTNM